MADKNKASSDSQSKDDKAKADAPKDDKAKAGAPTDDTAKADAPKDDKAKADAPKDDKAKADAPKDDKAKADAPKDDKAEAPAAKLAAPAPEPAPAPVPPPAAVADTGEAEFAELPKHNQIDTARPPESPAPPPGIAPPGDSRSLRRGNDFVLIYRESSYLITRAGTVGTEGRWDVVEYPSQGAAAHAYAMKCSELSGEGYRDLR